MKRDSVSAYVHIRRDTPSLVAVRILDGTFYPPNSCVGT